MATIHDGLERILDTYLQMRQSQPFSRNVAIWSDIDALQSQLHRSEPVSKRPTIQVKVSLGQGNWASVPWIAFLDSRETNSTQHGVYCVFLFRQDMSGVYLTYNQGVTRPVSEFGGRQGREQIRARAQELRIQCPELVQHGFTLDNRIDLRASGGLGRDYEHATIAYKLYEKGRVPAEQDILNDLEAVLAAYDRYLGPHLETPPRPSESLDVVIDYIASHGFVFEPWQIAAYVAALRTKPFVILAGVSGTGKSKLPKLVAEATGGVSKLVAVRPDWTDSSDVLGYVDLQGRFRPGALLQLAQEASAQPDKHFVCIMDEMNLARVEHYLAEVLSCIEDRRPCARGGFESGPLLNLGLEEADAKWGLLGLPPNLAIAGTVNMDESAHGFSRKVLDRAFTLEFSDIDLGVWNSAAMVPVATLVWSSTDWNPRAIQLSGLVDVTSQESRVIQQIVTSLEELNMILSMAQLQVGYRTRDEIALFVLNASRTTSSFVTRAGDLVDPLDLAIQMKVLPRIVGGSNAIRRVILQLLGWAYDGRLTAEEEEAQNWLTQWENDGRSWTLSGARFPRTAARLCLMWDRLVSEGFTSFWL